MSDDKLQLTASDYNAEAADEYSAVASDDAGTSNRKADEAENIELPATSSSTDRPLSEGYTASDLRQRRTQYIVMAILAHRTSFSILVRRTA